MKIYEFFSQIPPAELSRRRGRDQTNSTRDKDKFLSKIVEIQALLDAKRISLALIDNDTDPVAVHLVNTSVMPREGFYVMEKISKKNFAVLLQRYEDILKSHVGYQENIEIINKEMGLLVELLPARSKPPQIVSGDVLMIMRMKRLNDVSVEKSIEDFEFFIAKYI